MNIAVLIPAAGSGTRLGGEVPKQYLPLRSLPILSHTVNRFFSDPGISKIIIAVNGEHLPIAQELLDHHRWGNVQLVQGGHTRQQSVAAALAAGRRAGADIVAVHDAVRPFFRLETFRRVAEAAEKYGAACPAIPLADTIHRIQGDFIVETPERSSLMAAQTPQCFRTSLLEEVLAQALRDGVTGTDEAGLVARYGHRVRIVEGDRHNRKITTKEDFEAAEANFERWSGLE